MQPRRDSDKPLAHDVRSLGGVMQGSRGQLILNPPWLPGHWDPDLKGRPESGLENPVQWCISDGIDGVEIRILECVLNSRCLPRKMQ